MKEIYTQKNKHSAQRFDFIEQLDKEYPAAGLQLFWHNTVDIYRCRGPFTVDWECCAASHHPTLLGHELRATHHAMLWLPVLANAISELIHTLSHQQSAISPSATFPSATFPSMISPSHRKNITMLIQQDQSTTFPLKPSTKSGPFIDEIQW